MMTEASNSITTTASSTPNGMSVSNSTNSEVDGVGGQPQQQANEQMQSTTTTASDSTSDPGRYDNNSRTANDNNTSITANDETDHHEIPEPSVDQLANQISSTLHISTTTSTQHQQQPTDSSQQNLEEHGDNHDDVPDAIRTIAQWIQSSHKIVVLTGAGISVSAGIPDFRSPGTGLYDNLQSYNLPYPEAVFDVNFYRRNPKPFCSLAKEIWPGCSHISPTLTHSFLALLEQHDKLFRLYTQNIDGLEYLANVSSEKLVECHGHFRTASCIDCGKAADNVDEDVKNSIVVHGNTPRCNHCHGLVKPDIVFFGEGLPRRFGDLLPRDLEQADLLLVMGTSLQVAPVSMIPSMVSCPRILVNRELVGDFNDDNVDNGNNRTKTYNKKKKKNSTNKKQHEHDVVHLGDCDETVQIVAKLLGWTEKLKEAHAKSRNKQSPASKVEGTI